MDELLFWAVAIGVVLWVASVIRRGRTRERDKLAQDVVEKIGLGLLVQYPKCDDGEIVQLMRDELLNRRARDPLLFKWADVETVGRLRRTAVRAALGHFDAPEPPKPEPASPKVIGLTTERETDGTCTACGSPNALDRYKCGACGRIFKNPN